MGEICCDNCGYVNWHVFCHLTGICENCGVEIKKCFGCEPCEPITIIKEMCGFNQKTIWDRGGEMGILNYNVFKTFALKNGLRCHIKCHRPDKHGCNRINKISPEIDELIACEYYGIW